MNKSRILGICAVIVLALVAIVVYNKHSVSTGWETYTEKDFGFTIKYPSDWIMEDRLSHDSCCLFLARWVTSTTTVATSTTATSTAQTGTSTPAESVTIQELIKLQIGAYDKQYGDPYQNASTTKVMIGSTEFFVGNGQTGPFYLLPRNERVGVGIAEFRYIETSAADIETAQKILGSIKFIAMPEASTTISTSTATTSAKK